LPGGRTPSGNLVFLSTLSHGIIAENFFPEELKLYPYFADGLSD